MTYTGYLMSDPIYVYAGYLIYVYAGYLMLDTIYIYIYMYIYNDRV